MENSKEFPQKTKNRVTIWSSNPTPGHTSRENHNLKRYMYPSVYCSPIYNNQQHRTQKKPKCPPTEEWKKKMWYIYIMKYYSAIKKNKIMPFSATWMDLEIVILSEVRQKKTNIIWYHLYVKSKEILQMNLFTRQKLSYSWRKQTYGYQQGKGEEG